MDFSIIEIILECDCDEDGTYHPKFAPLCDNVTGACICKSKSIGGKRCDQCATGRFMYPACIR